MAVSMLLVTVGVLVQCLLILQPVQSQQIVDSDLCDTASINCGTPDSPATEKYCCVEANGGLQLLKCCNPYIGLTIGLCVGVPVVILIIVAIVVLYCCCAYYHNKKMANLAIAYSRSRNRQTEDITLAPPPYTTTDHTKDSSDSELPSYTKTDPYAALQVAPPPPPEPSSEGQGQAASGATYLEATIEVPEDIPLLSDDEQTQ